MKGDRDDEAKFGKPEGGAPPRVGGHWLIPRVQSSATSTSGRIHSMSSMATSWLVW